MLLKGDPKAKLANLYVQAQWRHLWEFLKLFLLHWLNQVGCTATLYTFWENLKIGKALDKYVAKQLHASYNMRQDFAALLVKEMKLVDIVLMSLLAGCFPGQDR